MFRYYDILLNTEKGVCKEISLYLIWKMSSYKELFFSNMNNDQSLLGWNQHYFCTMIVLEVKWSCYSQVTYWSDWSMSKRWHFRQGSNCHLLSILKLVSLTLDKRRNFPIINEPLNHTSNQCRSRFFLKKKVKRIWFASKPNDMTGRKSHWIQGFVGSRRPLKSWLRKNWNDFGRHAEHAGDEKRITRNYLKRRRKGGSYTPPK